MRYVCLEVSPIVVAVVAGSKNSNKNIGEPSALFKFNPRGILMDVMLKTGVSLFFIPIR
jgi:hypothetical protein